MEIRTRHIEELGSLLNERAGLKLPSDGEFGLQSAMRARMKTLGLESSLHYLALIRGGNGDEELRSLLPLLQLCRLTLTFQSLRGILLLGEGLLLLGEGLLL